MTWHLYSYTEDLRAETFPQFEHPEVKRDKKEGNVTMKSEKDAP